MRILWVCNVLPPMVAKQLHMAGSNKEGWITGALTRMIADAEDGSSNVALGLCFPVNSVDKESRYEVRLSDNFVVECYGYYEDQTRPELYEETLENRFNSIIDEFRPDAIHVFGTEFGHTLAVARVVKGTAVKLIIGIQGIISRCADEYTAGLPERVVKRYTFRDAIKHDNIDSQREKFRKRGKMEIEAIKLATDVTGRTEFDRNWCISINPDLRYHHMNETLRESFYEGTWDMAECEKHTIFVSQADYALKGFHILLDALPKIMEKYHDVRVRVAGAPIASYDGLKDKIKIGSYGKYLRELMIGYGILDNVQFLGRLDESRMKEEYLRCHTYVCMSSIENSPNSMGEAMLLGVPVVAPRVGGIPSMIEDKQEGILFEGCNADALAEAIIKMWDDDGMAMELGAHAMNRATSTHNADINYKRLLEIYQEL